MQYSRYSTLLIAHFFLPVGEPKAKDILLQLALQAATQLHCAAPAKNADCLLVHSFH